MAADFSYPRLLQSTVLREVPNVLARLEADGSIRSISSDSDALNECQFVYPLAYIYKTRFAGNRYAGDPSVLRSIRAVGDYIAASTERDGQVRAGSRGFDYHYVNQRVLQFWLEAYGLVKDELPSSTRRRWESAMKRTLVHLADKLARYMPQARFHSRSFHTGPNHAILYAAALTRGGRMFRHRGWRQLALAFAERFAAFQDPEGYWAEHDGPVGIYSSVSLAGIAAIHCLEPRPIFQNALERALRYHETVVYPDYTSVALIDRRMRYRCVPFIWGGAGFTRWPRGRAFLRSLARARLRCDEPFTAEEVARWLEAYVHCRRGPAPPYTPWRGVRYLGRHACFIRDRGWQVNFSVNPVVVDPTQSFSLDYQKVVSLWHRRTGLIVDGSQDKHRPEHDNFLFPGRTDPGVMVTGLIATQCKPRFVEAMYSNHIAVRVEADILDAANVVLTARETGLRRIDAVRFNLPLRVGIGSTIHVGRRPVVLSGKKCTVRVKRGEAVSLFDGNLVMRCDRGGRLHFPCRPWNSYSVDNRSDMEAAFLRFEIPLTGSPKSARVMFHLS